MPKTLEKPVEKLELVQVGPNLYIPADFEKNHAYFADAEGTKAYNGVTTILRVINKPALIQWSANCAVDYIEEHGGVGGTVALEVTPEVLKEARVAHRKKKEEAGVAGTDVHSMIEVVIKNAIELSEGFITIDNSGLNNQVDLFIQWAKDNKVKFLASELRLYSQTSWFAGTCDFVCEIGGKLYTGDIKTSSAIYAENFIQASAYASALTEMGLYKDFGGVIIVNLPKKGGLKVEENYDLEGNFNAFKACLILHKYLNA